MRNMPSIGPCPPDYEDALQVAAAVACGAQLRLTRNVRDYKGLPVQALTPEAVIAAHIAVAGGTIGTRAQAECSSSAQARTCLIVAPQGLIIKGLAVDEAKIRVSELLVEVESDAQFVIARRGLTVARRVSGSPVGTRRLPAAGRRPTRRVKR
jgi:antitoxin (DNA-binding transcriptional repressor) of toxin-antitoxin stability system